MEESESEDERGGGWGIPNIMDSHFVITWILLNEEHIMGEGKAILSMCTCGGNFLQVFLLKCFNRHQRCAQNYPRMTLV